MDTKLTAAIEVLKQNNLKITQQRQTLIQIMTQHENNILMSLK